VALASGDLAASIPDRTVRHRLGREDVARYALVAAFGLVLYLFILYPMGELAWRSLLANDGGFVGFANYARYFGTPAIARSISNSLAVSLCSMAITVTLAFGYAYGLTRTLMPWRGLFRVVAMLPLFAPSLVQALAFIYVFGNNGILTRLTAINVGIYGPKGIIVAEVFYCFPHALLILVAALSATDGRLYDAARTLGASPLKTFLTVTLPGVKFGLVSACFVVFTLVITDFGAPKAIGGKFSVMATEIYNQVSGQQNFAMGATVSVVLLIPAIIAFLVDRVVQRRQYALVTSSSRPLEPRRRPLADRGLFAYCAVVAAVIAGMYLAILVYSLVTRWPYNFTPTLKHYRFDTVGGYAPLLNSVYVAAWTALLGTALTFVGAYLVEKCGTVASRPLYFLSLLPVSIPGMVLGLAYIFAFNAPGSFLNRVRDLAILIISNVIHYFTVGFHGHDRTQADGRGVRERLRVARRALLPHLLARDGPHRAARHRLHQHVLLPERHGHALGRRVPRGAGHRAGRGGRPPDGRCRRHRAGGGHVRPDHRHRARRPVRLLGPHARREPPHPGVAREPGDGRVRRDVTLTERMRP
jgi:iron(III) transport system permease protein